MSQGTPTLIGSIVERKPGSSIPSAPRSNGSGRTGFPAVQHRSKSAFSRARSEQKKGEGIERLKHAPVVAKAGPSSVVSRDSDSPQDWRKQMEEENTRRVESMTEEERDQERRELLETFGSGIGDVLRRAREAREGKGKKEEENTIPAEEKPALKIFPLSPKAGATPRKSSFASRPSSPVPPSASSTRPSSRADRHIRFADVTPKDVFVYESAPPSPRRKPLALLAPSQDDGPTISLGEWKAKAKEDLNRALSNERDVPHPLSLSSSGPSDPSRDANQIEEGTPEDIRRRFFPSATPRDPSLAWMEQPVSQESLPTNSSLRFDLTGTPIPSSLSSSLPTHLGLHHHAEGTHAGYTLDDIFLLSRSTVPAQRASMLDILGKIARKLATGLVDPEKGIPELRGQEYDLRKRILAAGVEAMGERGSLGARAIETMWVCIVAWTDEVGSLQGVRRRNPSENDIDSSFPLEYVLPQIANAFNAAALPYESLAQLLAIVHHLALTSNDSCSKITSTDGLVAGLVQYFLLKPIPPPEDAAPPEPFAIQVLITLASASRKDATSLTGPADALLRFVVVLPHSSPYPISLSTSLLAATLRFYTVLASYGLYSQIAVTARELFHHLESYILSPSCQSSSLREAWLGLLEVWMVCARDPHHTTPSHDILWSQVVGWGYSEHLLQLRANIGTENLGVWGHLWRTLAAWLEGCSVNAIKGGEAEKTTIVQSVRGGFESGAEHIVVENTLRNLKRLFENVPANGEGIFEKQVFNEITSLAGILAACIRLWSSCLPTHTQEPLQAPPFSLPFPQLSAFCASLAAHPLWEPLHSNDQELPPSARVGLRQLSLLLAGYLNLSRALPGTTDDLWIAQAFAILPRLLPGDDEFAMKTIESIIRLVVPSFMTSRGWNVPPVIWEKKGLEPVLPFLVHGIRSGDIHVGPEWPTPYSISSSTTLRLPPGPIGSQERKKPSLPLFPDWIFCPLDYLLRSGETNVFKSLPSSWDASETELVRATLLFARVHREVLQLHGLHEVTMTREEIIFNCMKVFMLEHGQQDPDNSSNEEVFRDSIVGSFMDDLLAPFSFSTFSTTKSRSQHSRNDLLDSVATRFLGPGTPFYQYYTDFVGLYDSISFSHPTFARLLLPPLSMRYPVDYRKYLWVDYGHTLKTIKTPIEGVLSDDIAEYLWPVEPNTEVITGYLRALVRGQVEGFLRLVAVHHVASNVWSDLQGEDRISEEKSLKLLQAVVGQGDINVIREIVLYRQSVGSPVLFPPACFDQEGEWRVSRKELVGRAGDDVRDRLWGLL